MSEESRLGRERLLKIIRVELRNLHWSEADPDLVLNHEAGEPFPIDEDDEYPLRRAVSSQRLAWT